MESCFFSSFSCLDLDFLSSFGLNSSSLSEESDFFRVLGCTSVIAGACSWVVIGSFLLMSGGGMLMSVLDLLSSERDV